MTEVLFRLPCWALLVGTVGLLSAEEGAWSGWRGPHCTGVGPAAGVAMVEDLAAARLLWTSEARIPGTYEGDARKPRPRPEARIPGGYASPLYADGRVYLSYYEPNGPRYAAEVCDKHVAGGGVDRAMWYTDADDVLLCVDAETGKTLWKRIFVEQAYNQEAGFNKGGCQLTPCLAGGRVYFIGPSAYLYCVDGVTGDTVWRNDTGIRARYVEQLKTGMHESGTLVGGRNDFAGCVMTAGDVVAVSDHQEYKGGPRGMGLGNGLVGYAMVDGSCRWYVPGAGGNGMLGSTPLRWSDGDREYFIASGNAGVVLIDPADGSVRWSIPEARFDNAAAVGDDVLVCHQDKSLACYTISASLATLRWAQGDPMGFVSPALVDGYCYAIGNSGLRCIDLGDGTVQGTLPQESISGSIVAGDGILAVHASARGKVGLNLFRADAGDFRQLGATRPVPFANSTTAAYAHGRLYLRGRDRLHCYDLRAQP